MSRKKTDLPETDAGPGPGPQVGVKVAGRPTSNNNEAPRPRDHTSDPLYLSTMEGAWAAREAEGPVPRSPLKAQRTKTGRLAVETGTPDGEANPQEGTNPKAPGENPNMVDQLQNPYGSADQGTLEQSVKENHRGNS